jgi:hypothetical protein
MIEEILKCLLIYLSSTFKFIGGPALGKVFDFPFLLTAALTVAGMMTSVYVFSSLFGKRIHDWLLRNFYKDRKLFSRKTRRTVKIWRMYGLLGVSLLTPVLFTPIGGTIVAASFGENRKRIFKYMLVSAVLWAVIFSFIISRFDLKIFENFLYIII